MVTPGDSLLNFHFNAHLNWTVSVLLRPQITCALSKCWRLCCLFPHGEMQNVVPVPSEKSSSPGPPLSHHLVSSISLEPLSHVNSIHEVSRLMEKKATFSFLKCSLINANPLRLPPNKKERWTYGQTDRRKERKLFHMQGFWT